MKNGIVCLFLVIFMFITMTACGSNQTTVTGIDENKKNAYSVRFGEASFGKDVTGRSIIVLHYDFTNDSVTPVSPKGTVGHRAYQNGVKLEVVTEASKTIYDRSVLDTIAEPGKTVTDCQVAFVLDSSYPVDFEVSDWGDWSQKYIITYSVENGSN